MHVGLFPRTCFRNANIRTSESPAGPAPLQVSHASLVNGRFHLGFAERCSPRPADWKNWLRKDFETSPEIQTRKKAMRSDTFVAGPSTESVFYAFLIGTGADRAPTPDHRHGHAN